MSFLFRRIFAMAFIGVLGCARAPVQQPSTRELGAYPRALSYLGNSPDSGGHAGGDEQVVWASTPLPPPKSKEDEPSFCKLNPGGCPPLPASSDTEPDEPEEQSQDPWKSLACIQACEVGAEAMERFCQTLPNNTKKQKQIRSLCWGVSSGSKAACIVFCRAYFGPPRSP